MPENHVCCVEDKEVHEFGCSAGAETTVVDSFGLEVQPDGNRVYFDPLEEGHVACWALRGGFISEFEEAGHEVQCILVDMQSKGKDSGLKG